MTTEIALFILRVASGVLLFGILISLFYVIWRDQRNTVEQLQASRRSYGKLVALTEIDGSYARTGDTHSLLPITSLGRSPTNTIIQNDTFASSEHALITLRNGQWWLEDRQSRNGTLLNGEPVLEPIIITDGDIITIGKLSYQMELDR